MESIQLDLNKRYTYADYLTWLDDKRYELINGVVYDLPSGEPTIHQRILGNLLGSLWEQLSSKCCHVYCAPFDVRFPAKTGEIANDKIITVVQPDISIICDQSKLDDSGCIGVPDMIIEIVSRLSVRKDIGDKFRLYEENWVKEYWIVQPNDATLTVFMLENRKYQHKGMYTKGSKVDVNIFEGKLKVDLDDVFR